jgi:hypothetical protein
MYKIKNKIEDQNYERIRDRIAGILFVEFGGQLDLTGDTDFNLKVYVERSVPFDISEYSGINVCMDASTWDNKSQGSVRGKYHFTIDCLGASPTKGDDRGDMLAAKKSQKIAGRVRSILEDPIYKHLDFQPGVVSSSICNEMKFGNAGAPDAKNSMLSRVYLSVDAYEHSKLITPKLFKDYYTDVKIGESDEGYLYLVEQ